MKTLYICFLTLFFFISVNAQRSLLNYSYQKIGSNKLFIIENSKREDTVINKNKDITTKVISKTFIETVIDTITVPQEVDGYNAILIYFNNTDSSLIEEKNSLVYLPERLYMKKDYKSFKKYA